MKINRERVFKEIERAMSFYTDRSVIVIDPEKTLSIVKELDFLSTIAQLSMDTCNDDSIKILSVLKKAQRVFEGLPLIALENRDEDWIPIDSDKESYPRHYRHRYRNSLIKRVSRNKNQNETQIYIDTDMITDIDLDGAEDCDGTVLPPITKGVLSEYISREYLFNSQNPFPYFPTNRFRAYYYHPQKTKDLVRVIKLLHPSGALLPFTMLLSFDKDKGLWAECPDDIVFPKEQSNHIEKEK